MKNDIDNTQDMLDVRDIIAHFEGLETALLERFNEQQVMEGDDTETDDVESAHFINWLAQARADDEEAEEYFLLKKLLEDMADNGGGDEEWRNAWYPVTLIQDSYFEDAMDEMVEDCYGNQYTKELPSFMTITLDYNALQMDYTSVEYDGVTYWYR